MTSPSPPLERVIAELCRLPGIGRKTASQRLAFHLLKVPREEVAALASALGELRDSVRLCSTCFNLAEGEQCTICVDPRRDRSVLCVVEEAVNVAAMERTRAWRGLYHVLGGSLSPLKDIGPEDLRFDELAARIAAGEVREVVLATNPDVDPVHVDRTPAGCRLQPDTAHPDRSVGHAQPRLGLLRGERGQSGITN